MTLCWLQNDKNPRRGFSLVELVVVIGLTSLLLVVAMSLLSGIAAWGAHAFASQHRADSVFRFEQTLRKQLGQATQILAAEQSLSIELPDGGRAEWTLAGNQCLVRTTREGDANNQRFDIGPWQGWRVRSAGGLAEVELQSADNLPTKVLRIVAATSETQTSEAEE